MQAYADEFQSYPPTGIGKEFDWKALSIAEKAGYKAIAAALDRRRKRWNA